MQVLVDKTRNGELKVLIESLDDLWVIYNIIRENDQIKGRTFRRVVMREGDSGVRKPMTLLLNIQKVEFHEFTNRLRVLGTILEGPEDWVSTGQHHTFNLEPGSKITIFKEQWYRNDIQRIRRNLEQKSTSSVLCIAIENGLANIAMLTNYSLTPISEIKENIPGKRYSKQMHKEIVEKFYNNVITVIDENLAKYPLSLIVICGPGFTKEHFVETYREKHEKKSNNVKMAAISASSGEISAIYEILRNGSISTLKADFKIAQDEMMMQQFIEFLGKDNDMIMYGLDQVKQCSIMGAIEHLLICDVLLRVSEKESRAEIEEILNNTEKNRGQVHILSTMNPAGEQLENYGKIAAILRYKVNL
ncbi:mRNA surveillance protein pelota [Promethearchaeum syntrophicum]|uniref:Protein pelota homolog n=1 Tax=Promethearchaeum syntrophicum TaxID=2594042 RepID=A0A5B9D648_9ARCH|nr:mRNA surveillance protein pelota [Candidatus Prometheoarchaeum syntrophicum]QEE14456.1 Peptide chain release factor subunit 1 [Candidatus Prometheoarchaeum syntrophicum]